MERPKPRDYNDLGELVAAEQAYMDHIEAERDTLQAQLDERLLSNYDAGVLLSRLSNANWLLRKVRDCLLAAHMEKRLVLDIDAHLNPPKEKRTECLDG